MTEEDRDRVEQEAQQIISMCSEQIAGLQGDCEYKLSPSFVFVMSVKLSIVSAATEGENEQVIQCREEIVQSLHDYLKGRMFVKGYVPLRRPCSSKHS